MKRSLLALCFLFGACAGDEFDAIQITNATLDITTVSFMAIAGVAGGNGVLTFTEDDGTTGSCNITLRGPMLGGVFMFSGGKASINLSLPAASVPLSDVFGIYHGTAAGAGVIIGGENRKAKNSSGVSFDDSQFTFGIGAYAAGELLRLRQSALEDCVF